MALEQGSVTVAAKEDDLEVSSQFAPASPTHRFSLQLERLGKETGLDIFYKSQPSQST